MMYWIVFALFSAVESFTDPLGTIFIPFYTEMKVILLLYISLPLTRGSGVVYRRWIHPLLCSREEEIDKMLEALQEQGVSTAKLYMARVNSGRYNSAETSGDISGGSVPRGDDSQHCCEERGRPRPVSQEQLQPH